MDKKYRSHGYFSLDTRFVIRGTDSPDDTYPAPLASMPEVDYPEAPEVPVETTKPAIHIMQPVLIYDTGQPINVNLGIGDTNYLNVVVNKQTLRLNEEQTNLQPSTNIAIYYHNPGVYEEAKFRWTRLHINPLTKDVNSYTELYYSKTNMTFVKQFVVDTVFNTFMDSNIILLRLRNIRFDNFTLRQALLFNNTFRRNVGNEPIFPTNLEYMNFIRYKLGIPYGLEITSAIRAATSFSSNRTYKEVYDDEEQGIYLIDREEDEYNSEVFSVNFANYIRKERPYKLIKNKKEGKFITESERRLFRYVMVDDKPVLSYPEITRVDKFIFIHIDGAYVVPNNKYIIGDHFYYSNNTFASYYSLYYRLGSLGAVGEVFPSLYSLNTFQFNYNFYRHTESLIHRCYKNNDITYTEELSSSEGIRHAVIKEGSIPDLKEQSVKVSMFDPYKIVTKHRPRKRIVSTLNNIHVTYRGRDSLIPIHKPTDNNDSYSRDITQINLRESSSSVVTRNSAQRILVDSGPMPKFNGRYVDGYHISSDKGSYFLSRDGYAVANSDKGLPQRYSFINGQATFDRLSGQQLFYYVPNFIKRYDYDLANTGEVLGMKVNEYLYNNNGNPRGIDSPYYNFYNNLGYSSTIPNTNYDVYIFYRDPGEQSRGYIDNLEAYPVGPVTEYGLSTLYPSYYYRNPSIAEEQSGTIDPVSNESLTNTSLFPSGSYYNSNIFKTSSRIFVCPTYIKGISYGINSTLVVYTYRQLYYELSDGTLIADDAAHTIKLKKAVYYTITTVNDDYTTIELRRTIFDLELPIIDAYNKSKTDNGTDELFSSITLIPQYSNAP